MTSWPWNVVIKGPETAPMDFSMAAKTPLGPNWQWMTSKRFGLRRGFMACSKEKERAYRPNRNGFNALTVMLGAMSKDIGTALQPSSVLVMRDAPGVGCSTQRWLNSS